MAGKYFILQQVTDFAPGYFENTAMEEGSIQLGRNGRSYTTSGTYTSPPFTCEGFFDLLPSWNADVPPGATVEMQVRVSADGRWSHWFSFGVWSPYISRASIADQEDEIAEVRREHLTLKEGNPAADVVQMRVLLHTADPAVTPLVHMLAVSSDSASKIGQEPPAYDRVLSLPSYSAHTRDPAIADSIISATALVMMMNRWGVDRLPEEVARVCYDSAAGNFSNLAFLCAGVGSYGFRCQVGYAGISVLRRHVWLGRAVAARVQYRARALGEEETGHEDEDASLPPLIEGARYNSKGHLVAVHGFTVEDGVETVVLSDPASESDAGVVRHIPFASFTKMYTGIAVFMEPGPPLAGRDRPRRRLARLEVEGCTLRLMDGDEEIVPARLESVNLAPATMCYTLGDGVAYASAAQRSFYYPTRDEDGAVRFDRAAAAGRRMTFYLFGTGGRSWVAEKQIEAEEVAEAREEPEKGGGGHDV